MKKEFVLIYVSGGIAHVHNSSSTPVAVLDMDVQWDTHEQELIHEQEQAAYDRLCGQLGEETPELSMTGLEQALSSPAPVDWEAESDRYVQNRDKAIAFIEEAITRNGGKITLLDKFWYGPDHAPHVADGVKMHYDSPCLSLGGRRVLGIDIMRTGDLIMLAGMVQAATKGGAGK